MKKNKSQEYAIKWNIKLGKTYLKNYEKMLKEEKFGDVWELITKNEVRALDAFHEELHNMHFRYVGNYLNKILRIMLIKQKEELKKSKNGVDRKN